MHIEIAERALASLREAPIEVRKAFYKQLLFLERSLLHPSLHAKKYDEGKDLWQARVNRSWRGRKMGADVVFMTILPE